MPSTSQVVSKLHIESRLRGGWSRTRTLMTLRRMAAMMRMKTTLMAMLRITTTLLLQNRINNPRSDNGPNSPTSSKASPWTLTGTRIFSQTERHKSSGRNRRYHQTQQCYHLRPTSTVLSSRGRATRTSIA